MLGFLDIEFHHVLMLLWLAAGGAALWIAQRLHIPRHKTVNILLPMALGLMIFTFYVSTRFNSDFLIDDVDIVEKNPHVVNRGGLKTLWSADYWAGRSSDRNLYRPITTLSYWINARLPMGGKLVDGTAVEIYPRYFRGVNMALLLCLSWLIALWLMRYVQQAAAWTVAFLFAAHPAHGEMVNYIVCRADLLAMLGIVSFLLMQRLAQEQGRWRGWQALLAFLSAVVAVGSKESGLILIPAALVQAWIGTRSASTDIIDEIPVIPRRTHAATLALVLVPVVAFLVQRVNVVGAGVDYAPVFVDDVRDNPLRMVGAAERIPAAVSIAGFYVRQIVSPDTSYYHIPAALPTWTSGATIRGLTVLAVAVILGVSFLRRRHWLLMALVIAAGQYVLIGNLVMPVGVYAANRLILPFSLAAAMVLAALLHHWCGHSIRSRAVVMLPTCVVLLLMGIALLDVNYHWRTEARLMGHDYKLHVDNPVAAYNFATVRAGEGRFTQEYTAALQGAIEMIALLQAQPPGSPTLESDLRPMQERLRKQYQNWSKTSHRTELILPLREAIVLVDRVLATESKVAVTPGDVEKVAKALHDDLTAQHVLADQYLDEAMVLLEEVSQRRPQSRSAALELAKVYEFQGQLELARREYDRVVKIATRANDPRALVDTKVVEARIQFAWLSMRQGKEPVAASQQLLAAEKALSDLLANEKQLPPRHAAHLHYLNRSALRYLGLLTAQLGDIPSAQKRFRDLLLRYPDFEEARQDLPKLHLQGDPPQSHVPAARTPWVSESSGVPAAIQR